MSTVVMIRLLLIAFLVYLNLCVKSQELHLNMPDNKIMSDKVEHFFSRYQSFHEEFFSISNKWAFTPCNDTQFLVSRKLDKETKEKAYAKFTRKVFLLKGAQAFKETKGESWLQVNQSHNEFTEYLLSYFKESKLITEQECNEKETLEKIKAHRFLIKSVQLDSIGRALKSIGKKGYFIPIYFKSKIKYLNGNEITFDRVLIVNVESQLKSSRIQVHQLINYVSDWKKHSNFFVVENAKSRTKSTVHPKIMAITHSNVPSNTVKELPKIGLSIPRRLANYNVNSFGDTDRTASDVEQTSGRSMVYNEISKLKNTDEVINQYYIYERKSSSDFYENIAETLPIITEQCDTIYFPAMQIAYQMTQQYGDFIQSLYDPNFSGQSREAYTLYAEAFLNKFISERSIIEFWNFGESTPIARTVNQYLNALYNLTKKSWYSDINICIPNEEVRVLDRVLTSPEEGYYKFSILFSQYFVGIAGTRPTYRDRIVRQMDISIPVNNCQYGPPKIIAVYALEEPNLFNRFPASVNCS